ncbi:MAG: hypothetical protein GTN65_07800 [Armatimonadetes bacterium]|nr:hypothetical protein [Armatimonadota bacterium]NIO96988.1 hypothetical protein [Armatimonadota bacterium]
MFTPILRYAQGKPWSSPIQGEENVFLNTDCCGKVRGVGAIAPAIKLLHSK